MEGTCAQRGAQAVYAHCRCRLARAGASRRPRRVRERLGRLQRQTWRGNGRIWCNPERGEDGGLARLPWKRGQAELAGFALPTVIQPAREAKMRGRTLSL